MRNKAITAGFGTIVAKVSFIMILLFMLLTPFQKVQAQVVLYMEIMSEDKPIKYYEGQTLMYKSKEFPDDWQTIKIERILDEEKIILYDGGMLQLDNIKTIRRTRGWAKAIGYMLQTFGLAWLGWGSIASVTTDNVDFTLDTALTGGTALLSGYLIRKLFYYKNYKVGRRVRLKILDLSWPEPRGY
ncbi:MAG: hypothetical protein AAGA77_06045 [Bacteroidota bacterium]